MGGWSGTTNTAPAAAAVPMAADSYRIVTTVVDHYLCDAVIVTVAMVGTTKMRTPRHKEVYNSKQAHLDAGCPPRDRLQRERAA
jgi:hypothetical protein